MTIDVPIRDANEGHVSSDDRRQHWPAIVQTMLFSGIPVLSAEFVLWRTRPNIPLSNWMQLNGVLIIFLLLSIKYSNFSATNVTSSDSRRSSRFLLLISALTVGAMTWWHSELLYGGVLSPVLLGVVLGSFGTMVCTLVAQPRFNRMTRVHWYGLIVALSAGAAFFLTGRSLLAQWGIIDDHEVIRWFNAASRLNPGNVRAVLMETEIGHWGESLRYRPAYYVVRALEAMLWGNNPTMWYAARIAIFTASLSLSWIALARITSFALSGAFLGYSLTFPFWADIWPRLGPAETYAVLGLSVWLVGATALIPPPAPAHKESFWPWVAMAVGAILAMGSKENFLFLGPIMLVVAVIVHRRGRLPMSGRIATVIVCAWGLIIVGGLMIALRHAGTDIYENKIGVHQESMALVRGLRIGATTFLPLCVLAIPAVVLASMPHRNHIPINSRRLLWNGVAIILLMLLWVSQYVFYSGKWPNGSRYDFPGVLTFPLAVFLLLHVIIDELAARWRHVPIAAAKAGLYVAIALVCMGSGYAYLLSAAHANAVQTIQFTKRIGEIAKRLSEDRKRPLVLITHRPMDCEPLVSVLRFLRSEGVTNPIGVELVGYRITSATPGLERTLTEKMNRWSTSGSSGERLSFLSDRPDMEFLPLNELKSSIHPFTLGFSGEASDDAFGLGRVF